ncbi:hypothetical protein [Paenibacillus polymyxa]|nr:hypothetical protein [Paenibacillus polymyxa]MDN4106686.1 hypothetical protein [Paenibacillus polymyxa]
MAKNKKQPVEIRDQSIKFTDSNVPLSPSRAVVTYRRLAAGQTSLHTHG